ncbi:hypothetical protein ACFZCL_13325 [Streptomyces sp. NPDC008159]|uniref:hypothetical protein n=1 Tax=Streptomyces sp. NPDC008159 TaxID=3364817 RepID=UPI0036EEDB8F
MNGSGGSRRGHGSDGRHGDDEGRAMPSGRAESDMGERRHGEAGHDGRPARNDAPAPAPGRPTDSPADHTDADRTHTADSSDVGHTGNVGRPAVGRADAGDGSDVGHAGNVGRPAAGRTHTADSPDAAPCPDLAHAGPSSIGVSPADASSVDLLLAVAVRGRPEVDSAGEARALAAFRAAREQGPRTVRTRRRDDWRPNPRRRVQLSVRTTLAVLLSSLTLGGVAFAAIGSATRDDAAGPGRGEDGRTGTSRSAPAAPGSSGTPGAGSSTGDRPASARDTEAHCRAYEEQVEGRGRALDATAWRRLTDAAGGTEKVAAYCAARLGDADDAGDRKQRVGDSAGKRDGTERSTGADAGRKPDDAGVPADAATGKPDGAGEPTAPGASDGADRQGQADQEGRTDTESQTDQGGREGEPKDADAPGRVDGADKAPETK